MELQKFLMFFTFTSLCYTVIGSAELSDRLVAGEANNAISGAEASDDFLRDELDQLKASDASLGDELNSKISYIGSKVDEGVQELTRKEKTIKELEMVIEERSDILMALQSCMQLLKEINNLEKEIEAQNKKKDALEAQITIAERKIQSFHLKLENLHRTNDEQKSRLFSNQLDIQAVEEEMVKDKLEATSISKQLIKSFIVSYWNKHGRPALHLAKEKALEKKSEFEKWLKSHVDTFKSEWAPSIKEQWLAFLDEFGWHLQSVFNMAIEQYHACKESLEPHAVRLKEVTSNSVEPHVLRLNQGMHPYYQKAKKVMAPYMKSFLHGYKIFVGKVNALHRQFVDPNQPLLLLSSQHLFSSCTPLFQGYTSLLLLLLLVSFQTPPFKLHSLTSRLHLLVAAAELTALSLWLEETCIKIESRGSLLSMRENTYRRKGFVKLSASCSLEETGNSLINPCVYFSLTK